MFKKLSIILNFIVLLASLLVEIGASAHESKDIDQLQKAIMKQNHPNTKVTSTKYSPAWQKSRKTSAKDDIVVPSFIIDEEALFATTSFKPKISYSQQNTPYINANSTNNYLTNKDRIRLERVDRVNTLNKSLGKTGRCQDNLPIYKDPNDKAFFKLDPTNKSFTIDPANLIRLLDKDAP